MAGRTSAIGVGMMVIIGIACTGGSTGGGGGGGGGTSGGGGEDTAVQFSMGTALLCDPDYSWTDDIFYFQAVVEPQPDEVIAWFNPGDQRIDLEYDAPADVWYASEWADDLNADCDDINSLSADFSAYADGEEVADGRASAEMY